MALSLLVGTGLTHFWDREVVASTTGGFFSTQLRLEPWFPFLVAQGGFLAFLTTGVLQASLLVSSLEPEVFQQEMFPGSCRSSLGEVGAALL